MDKWQYRELQGDAAAGTTDVNKVKIGCYGQLYAN